MNLLGVFQQTLDVTLPVFAMVFLGIGLKRIGWIDDRFINTASALVFKGTMPTLIFLSIAKTDMETAFLPHLVAFFATATLAMFGLIWAWALWRVPHAERGVYVQGGFRGNCAIVALALAAEMYGDFGLSAGAVLVGVVIVIYNVLSVIVLAYYQPGQQADWRSMLHGIGTNPLILGVVCAIAVAATGLQLPSWVMTSGAYFAALTLPLALICIGGTISVAALKQARGIAFGAAGIKLIGLPVLATAAAWLAGFDGRELGLLYLFFATPTAAASFIMVQAMGGDARLAANIVAITTLGASVTITAGVLALRLLGLI